MEILPTPSEGGLGECGDAGYPLRGRIRAVWRCCLHLQREDWGSVEMLPTPSEGGLGECGDAANTFRGMIRGMWRCCLHLQRED